MNKFVLGLICFCFFVLPSFSFTLKGGVTYTVESARKEAFANVEYSLPKSIIDANRIDPNFEDNKVLIKNGISETSDRHITYYSDGGYSIVYKNNLYYVFYYDKNGKITYIDKRQTLFYPVKAFTFNPYGKLIRVSISIKNEDYIFFPNGQLESHWVGNTEYDLNGNVINNRY